MTPIVVPAPPGIAVDTSSKIRTPAVLDALSVHGYQGIIRYVPLPGVDASLDIDPVELQMILAHPARLWSCWVQHPRYAGWRPRDCLPEADAYCAAKAAHAAGYANGVTGYVDLEGMAADTSVDEAFEFAMKWLGVIVSEGFTPGAYWGFDQPIPPDKRGLVGAKTHWSDAGNRQVVGRGCAMTQGQQFSLMGIPFDPDEIKPDAMGETPIVYRASGSMMMAAVKAPVA